MAGAVSQQQPCLQTWHQHSKSLALQRQPGACTNDGQRCNQIINCSKTTALNRECMLKVFINEHLTGSASLFEVMFSPAF